MDYDKLVERLYQHNKDYGEGWTQNFFRVCLDCKDAALAIETLRADLARVTAKRDAAVDEVKHLKAVMRDEGIVVIPPKYPWERPEWNR